MLAAVQFLRFQPFSLCACSCSVRVCHSAWRFERVAVVHAEHESSLRLVVHATRENGEGSAQKSMCASKQNHVKTRGCQHEAFYLVVFVFVCVHRIRYTCRTCCVSCCGATWACTRWRWRAAAATCSTSRTCSSCSYTRCWTRRPPPRSPFQVSSRSWQTAASVTCQQRDDTGIRVDAIIRKSCVCFACRSALAAGRCICSRIPRVLSSYRSLRAKDGSGSVAVFLLDCR